PDRQSIVPILLQALDGRFDQRPASLIGQLALEARLSSFFLGALQSGSPVEPPPFEVGQDFPGGIMPRSARDATPWMGTRAAHVEARQRASVVSVTQNWPCREHLIQLQNTV